MPLRTACGATLLVAFLVATLTPCVPGVEAGAPARAGEAVATHAHASTAAGGAGVSVTAACPCGCERPPLAGASARLGVALLTSPPRLVIASAAPRDPAPVARRLPLLAIRIDHVPLPTAV